MLQYRYVKAPIPGVPKTVTTVTVPYSKTANLSVVSRFLPAIFVVLGISLLSLVIYPLVSYQINLFRWNQEAIISPVPEIALAESKGFAIPVSGKIDSQPVEGIKVIDNSDYKTDKYS